METASPIRLPLQVSFIGDHLGFLRLESAWNHLAAQTSDSIFLRHEWAAAAWAWRRADADLFIVCAYAGSTLVGLLPMVRPHALQMHGRVLQFLAVPDTQWCDLMAVPEHAQAVGEAIAGELMKRCADWDAIRLDRLHPDSRAETALLPALSRHGVTARLEAVDCNLYVDLAGSWDSYYASRSRKVRKACNLAANRLGRDGTPSIERFDSSAADRDQLGRLFDDAVEVSSRSWKHGTGTCLAMPGPRAFIRHLTDVAAERGWLSLWLLRLQGRPIAMEYQLVYGGRVHALRADFDEAHRHASPGTYLNRQLIEGLFATDSERYYLGPGRNEYKKSWSDTGDLVYAITGFAPTARGRALAVWDGIKPTLRAWKIRLGARRSAPA